MEKGRGEGEMMKRQELEEKLEALRAALEDREKALPAHSVRPQQLLAIEALEEEIAGVESELRRLADPSDPEGGTA